MQHTMENKNQNCCRYMFNLKFKKKTLLACRHPFIWGLIRCNSGLEQDIFDQLIPIV